MGLGFGVEGSMFRGLGFRVYLGVMHRAQRLLGRERVAEVIRGVCEGRPGHRLRVVHPGQRLHVVHPVFRAGHARMRLEREREERALRVKREERAVR